ncbi:MAG: YoaK family protein [Thermoflexibacter sp.]
MFQQIGQKRRFIHDLGLAALLAMVAGSVNVASFFAFEVLTTNVTGHVASLASEIVAKRWQMAMVKMLWMVMFFLGAFFSGLMIEIVGRRYPRLSHTVPLTVELGLLIFVTYHGTHYYDYSQELIQLLAGSLLFAMGIQNAMVTMVSGSVVRTTHLTGLFTDIGIEGAKLMVGFKDPKEKQKMRDKFTLHIIIVTSFLLGGTIGGFFYANYLFISFLFPIFLIVLAASYDIAYSRLHSARQKNKTKTLEKLSA